MWPASNKLKDIIRYCNDELISVYETSEAIAIIDLMTESFLAISKKNQTQFLETNINQSDFIKFIAALKKLKKHIPIQYILESAWFYNLQFYVNPHVLIPRPETEELVNIILKENKNLQSVLDIGTGSGCIPISIKKNSPLTKVVACDISKDALIVARKNSELLNADVTFFEGNILNTNDFLNQHTPDYECIISNPPYIKQSEKNSLEKQVIAHEPHLALFVEEEDEIVFYKKIIDLCESKLIKNGVLYFELNPFTSNLVLEYATNKKIFNTLEFINDMSGKCRFLKACKN